MASQKASISKTLRLLCQVQIVGDDLLVTNPKRIGKAVEDGDDARL